MKAHMNLRHEDLAFRFGLNQVRVTRIIQKWIPHLITELKLLIHPVSTEQNLGANVESILDCTEGQVENSDMARSQTYSLYNSIFVRTLADLESLEKSGNPGNPRKVRELNVAVENLF